MFILCLGGGIAALDAQALFYLGPFVMRDLRISNSGIGILSAAVLLTWAISGFTTSVLSDRGGARKQFIVASYLLFGVLSFISGLASSLWMLLVARLLMGVAEGPIVPLTHAVMIAESSPRRRGFNMGMVQSVGAQLVGSTVSPLLLVWLATAYSWRKAFFLAGLPGIGLAVLVMAYVREPPVEDRVATVQQPRLPARIKELLRSPNIRVCLVMSCFLNAWYFGFLTFMPLYLVKFLHLSPREMSQVMASAGIGAVLGAALVPLLSDRFGRKPVMTLFALLGAAGPLGALIPGTSVGQLMAFAFVGAWAQGALPLCIGTVPMESIASRSATASGLIMGSGMILGGLIGPAVCGRLADLIDLSVPIWCCVVAALAGAITSRGLTETAPFLRRLATSQSA